MFIRRKENFQCIQCGAIVKGTGYTNHCPECLYSRHVDIHPGDRQETCGGLMRPIALELKHGEYTLIHLCETCGAKRKNKVASNDNQEVLRRVAREHYEV
ncbi:MAG: RNHCP domain-containing protein [Candidatus Kerfeldbacteria bacterium]|nr:RNHCP domain-containing protein [Candidatus Kerfeldbacteria bacterium]